MITPDVSFISTCIRGNIIFRLLTILTKILKKKNFDETFIMYFKAFHEKKKNDYIK